MQVTQVYSLVNQALKETLGETAVLKEDLSNVVDMGDTLANAEGYDAYVKALVNRIGREIYVSRPYQGSVPSVLRDSWEFGSILMKVSGSIPEVEENVDWEIGDMDGQVASPYWIKLPRGIRVRFYNKRITFRLKQTIAYNQVKQSFTSAAEMNSFVSMLYDLIEKAMTVAIDNLIMRALNNMTAHTLATSAGTPRAVNLLAKYKAVFPAATTTAATALYDPEFIRFAIMEINKTAKRMAKLSTLYNVAGQPRFTPNDFMRCVMLDDFAQAAGVYLYDGNGQFRVDNLALPTAETVPYWQGPGEDYGFDDVSKIDVTASDGNTVSQTGVICTLRDRDSVVVACLDETTRTLYNPEVDGTNLWRNAQMGLINDDAENYVCFYIADATT